MKPGESAMGVLMQAACLRLAAPEQTRCDPDSLADQTGIDRRVARALFPDEAAVLKAVAESALRRQLDHLTRNLAAAPGDNPAAQLTTMVTAFLDWARENQTDFRILNSDLLTDIIDQEQLRRYHHSLRDITIAMLERARERGQLRQDIDLALLSLIGRAFAYGLARLCVDRQLDLWTTNHPEWDQDAWTRAAMEAFADLATLGWRTEDPSAQAALSGA